MFLTFDIETGPRCIGELSDLMPEFDESKYQPTPFDPEGVKYGNTKDAEKRDRIFAEAKLKHAAEQRGLGAQMAADRNAHENKFLEKAALSAITGRVLCVGMRNIDGSFFLFEHDDENKLLEQVFAALDTNYLIVGHNIHGFDLPFLMQRAIMLDMDYPSHWCDDRGFWNGQFVDTMKRWSFGKRGEFVSLDYLGKALGLGGKTDGVDGADFARLWKEDRELAIEYVKRDVMLTYDVAVRLAI